MDTFKINIDGIETEGAEGQTILDAARENNIYIPTLCNDDNKNLEPSGPAGFALLRFGAGQNFYAPVLPLLRREWLFALIMYGFVKAAGQRSN